MQVPIRKAGGPWADVILGPRTPPFTGNIYKNKKYSYKWHTPQIPRDKCFTITLGTAVRMKLTSIYDISFQIASILKWKILISYFVNSLYNNNRKTPNFFSRTTPFIRTRKRVYRQFKGTLKPRGPGKNPDLSMRSYKVLSRSLYGTISLRYHKLIKCHITNM